MGASNSQFDQMLAHAQDTRSFIHDLAAHYSKEERCAMRTDKAYTDAFINRTVNNILYIASHHFKRHPSVHAVPSYAELPNTFIFRASLCAYLLALDWVANGGVQDAAPATLRNDLVDVNFAAYSTYFDGLLTADKKPRRLQREARVWLIALFDCKLPGGLGYDPKTHEA